jgi:membrane protease YdiL (CAAX protease family)
MDNNDKDIINFDDLFKKEIEERKELRDPERKKRYGYTLLIYLLMMNVVVAIFYVIFLTIPSFTVTYSEEELLVEALAVTESGLVIMDEDIYLEIDHPYESYITNIGIYDNYVVLLNESNTHYEGLLVVDDLLDETYLESILSGLVTTWGDSGNEIVLIAGKDQVLPLVFTAEYVEIDGPITDLSTPSFSILNFVIYIIMLPLILWMMKKEVVTDFSVAKTWRSEWLTIIFIGYVYLMIGNFTSNVLSELFADIFNVISGESVNQLSIQSALNSNGLIFMFVSAVILGPIVEELVFRKAMFGLFKNDYVGLAVSSITFGAIHLLGESSIQLAIVNGLVYFVMGFVFGLIYLRNNKNIYAPIAVHIFSNLLSIIFILTGLGG